MLDASGQVDLYPLLLQASAESGVDVLAILMLAIAESGLRIDAERKGDWPDWSVGLMQVTVASAGFRQDQWDEYRDYMLDPLTSLKAGAVHYARNLAFVDRMLPGLNYDIRLVMGARVYNAGSWGLSDKYAMSYAAAINRYEQALELAYQKLGDAP